MFFICIENQRGTRQNCDGSNEKSGLVDGKSGPAVVRLQKSQKLVELVYF